MYLSLAGTLCKGMEVSVVGELRPLSASGSFLPLK